LRGDLLMICNIIRTLLLTSSKPEQLMINRTWIVDSMYLRFMPKAAIDQQSIQAYLSSGTISRYKRASVIIMPYLLLSIIQ
jgi:hypothetical protein